jgi:hypothetical protein
VSARQPVPFTVSFSMVTWSPDGPAADARAGVIIVTERSSAAITRMPSTQTSKTG